jgi:NAD(P)-dependent dehydrogenase (short-subunit alcohol dehydrogenase family)
MGVEMTMAVNYFGHFYLTYLLLPCLKISKEARIINVSSRSYMLDHWSSCADLKCEEGFDTMVQLKKSKVAVVQFNFGLAEKLKKYPHIKTMSLDPGIHCEPLNARIGATTSLYLARL